MKKTLLLVLIIALALLLITGCGTRPEDLPDNPPDTAEDISEQAPGNAFQFTLENMPLIDGSTANIPLIEAVYTVLLGIPRAEAAEMVSISGTDNAYVNLIDKKVDLLLVYSPAPDSLTYAKQQGVELEMAPIGRDALVFLVNKANPVDSLTHQQLVDIYSGQVDNWADVGGDDSQIKAFQRQHLSGSQTMMDAHVMKDVPMADTEAEYVIGDMGGLVEAVAHYDNSSSSIGYNVYFYVSRMKLDDNIKLLQVGGVTPSVESISNGDYPFVSDFYVVIRGEAEENSPERILYDWIQCEDGQALVANEGYALAK